MQSVVADSNAPLVGWRYWYASERDPLRLRSVSHPRFAWEPGKALRATCVFRHAAPAQECNCGVYGAQDLDTLRERGLCLRPGILLCGEVNLWGKVIRRGADYRAEYAYPRTLHVVAETVSGRPLQAVMESLAAYEVPVGEMAGERAIGELSRTFISFQAMSGRDRHSASRQGGEPAPL